MASAHVKLLFPPLPLRVRVQFLQDLLSATETADPVRHMQLVAVIFNYNSSFMGDLMGILCAFNHLIDEHRQLPSRLRSSHLLGSGFDLREWEAVAMVAMGLKDDAMRILPSFCSAHGLKSMPTLPGMDALTSFIKSLEDYMHNSSYRRSDKGESSVCRVH